MSLPAPLMFTIGLIDQITRPIAKISQGLNGLASNYQAGTMQMASGIGGIAASGYALQNALMPAIEMDRALGEVKSLGVQDDALKMLANNSYDYALKYGKSSTDFVRSSYDIQSAIAGLNASDLSRFTMSSNVLAAATKADAATVTSYMGTMYGIFKNDAMQMGEGAWVERLTGMTATAVQAFKTDGKKMADAFGALGASAGLAPLQEQMAIMGTLQATMEGSASATKYQAFLAGVGKAQKALGMSFVDSKGQMLPIVDILEKIKGKYGDLSSVQSDIDKFDVAFGSRDARALIQLLLKDVDGLKGSINSLGQVKGMEQAEKMAAAMTDQSQRLAQSWYVIRAAFGTAILPTFNLFVGKLADMGKEVVWFTQMFPNITKVLGYGAIAVTGLLIGFGALTAIMGLFSILASPIILVTAAVVGLGAAIGFGIAYADELKQMLGDSTWGKGLLSVISTLGGAFLGLKESWLSFFNPMMEAFSLISPLFSGIGDAIGMALMSLLEALAIVASGIINVLGWLMKAGGWLIDVSNGVAKFLGADSGIDINANTMPSVDAISPVQANLTRGGVSQQIANANNSKSTTVGNINIYPQKVDTNFANYVEMHS
ncbi:phage tail tape measure protein [Shewanella baltica]|uniref:phage tail tape measure protein n=1 Tax=Shewanella baltica TaxID=62322 RepID=UPI0021675B43|nr:phage tail tape measure protein [Shewanella baltica]MCS6115236.1 phage tail tape measure protein [Shewanella baltica]UVW63725.1 phage tail tape measure protein [Shewanella baltica]